jgi:hypothetical protein
VVKSHALSTLRHNQRVQLRPHFSTQKISPESGLGPTKRRVKSLQKADRQALFFCGREADVSPPGTLGGHLTHKALECRSACNSREPVDQANDERKREQAKSGVGVGWQWNSCLAALHTSILCAKQRLFSDADHISREFHGARKTYPKKCVLKGRGFSRAPRAAWAGVSP